MFTLYLKAGIRILRQNGDARSVSGLNVCTESETSVADPGKFDLAGGGGPKFGSEGTVELFCDQLRK